MADAELGIRMRARDEATQDLKRIEQLLGQVERKSQTAGGALRNIASTAAGVFTGMLGAQVLGNVIGGFQGMIGSMIDANAELESLGKSFEILLSDAAAAGSEVKDAAGVMTEAMSTAGTRITDVQEKMTDAAEDHAASLSKIGRDMTRASQEAVKALAKIDDAYDESTATMGAKYVAALSKMAAEEAKLTQVYQEQIGSRGNTFKSSMVDLEANHGKMVSGMQDQLKKLQDQFEQQVKDRKARNADEAKHAPDKYTREKSAAKNAADYIKQQIAEEYKNGAAADQQLIAALLRRLDEEERAQKMSYGEYLGLLRTRQQEEEKAARSAQETQIAAVKQRMADEQAEFTKRQVALQAKYAADLANYKQNLDEKMAAFVVKRAEEQQEYADGMAKLKIRYAEDVASVREAEGEKLAMLKERLAEEEKGYARIVRDAEQAMNKAKASYQDAVKDATLATGGSVNQMEQMYANLAEAVGRPLESAKDRAGAMLDWIKQKAKETPFDLPEVQAAAQRLIAYQLDATQFLDTVGNVASGMNVPVKQVADAFGALATGQMGEAVMRFREFGVNLKAIEGLKFDAKGALVTPVDEALTLLKGAMDKRFGGMMKEQSGTWKGIMSNLRDTWGQFLQTTGQPIFVEARESLKGILKLVDDNSEKLKELGSIIGKGVGQALKDLKPTAEAAITGLFEWINTGQAKRDVDDFVLAAQDIVVFTKDVLLFGREATTAMKDLAGWIKDNEILVGTLLLAVGLLVAILGGPLLWAIAGIVIGWKLAGKEITQFLEQARDFWLWIFESIWGEWKRWIDGGVEDVKNLIKAVGDLIDLLGKLPGIEGLGDLLGGITGTPAGPPGNIYGYATGGIVPGPMGAAQLAVVHGGEAIIPPGLGMPRGGDTYVTVQVSGSVISERDLGRVVREELLRVGRRTVTGGILG